MKKLTAVMISLCLVFLSGMLGITKDNAYALEGSDELYYLNMSGLYFNLTNLQSSYKDTNADIKARFMNTGAYFEAVNKSSIQDMKYVDYKSTKVPSTGYTTSMIKIEVNHVYAIRCNDKTYSIIKVTNLVDGSDVEFMTRKATVDLSYKTTTIPKNTTGPKPVQTPPKPLSTKKKAPTLEVVSGNVCKLNGKVLFKDSYKIYSPFISPDKKYVVYSSMRMDLKLYNIKKKTIVKIYDLPYNECYGKDTALGHVPGYRIVPVTWTSDSKSVIYMKYSVSGFSGGDSLYQISISGGKPKFLRKLNSK